MVDVTLVPAPKQRNIEDEQAAINESKTPQRWNENPAKLCQKDRDAGWSPKYSKAKVKEGKRCSQPTLACGRSSSMRDAG
ncbi:hypothetical protein Ga0102493_111368 [Erythrobacter litoralis]|nr:hypothetical protein Ga0102493_111368 [Erythrobacter litoralis]